jgi:hypothetical protein
VSDDEAMAKALGEIMMEQDERIDPRLELYAQGRLSADEKRELEERAKHDPLLAAALELHRPLAPAFKEQLKVTAMNAPRAKVLQLRKPAIALMAAAAAAAVTFLLIDRQPEVAPRYALVAKAGDAEWRGEVAAVAKKETRADSEISLVLRPEKPVEGAIEASLFVVKDGQKARSPVAAEVSADGAARWIGRADELSGGRTGTVTLIAEIGRAGEQPWQSSAIDVLIQPVP